MFNSMPAPSFTLLLFFEFFSTTLRLLQPLQPRFHQNRNQSLFCLCWYQMPAKCVVVSRTRRLPPVSGARNRYRQLAPENWRVCHRYKFLPSSVMYAWIAEFAGRSVFSYSDHLSSYAKSEWCNLTPPVKLQAPVFF